jgi:hypothetical protein
MAMQYDDDFKLDRLLTLLFAAVVLVLLALNILLRRWFLVGCSLGALVWCVWWWRHIRLAQTVRIYRRELREASRAWRGGHDSV